MATALKELINRLNSFAWADTCDKENVIIIIDELLDKEQQQLKEREEEFKKAVIEAYQVGVESGHYKGYSGQTGEEYFNTKHKNK